MTEVAIVILNYNGKAHLEKFLPSVLSFSENARIIVADNGSTDDSIEFLSSNFSSVEIICIEENLGYTGGYNFVIPKIEQEVLVLLNSDVRVTDGWLEPMIAMFDADDKLAAAQPKILSEENNQIFEYAGAAGGFIDYLGYPFCRGRIFNQLERDNGQFNDQIPIFWASGACLFIRKRAFLEVGGFDKDFFAHMEEIDLCWRLQNSGYNIYFNGASTVYHLGGGTLSSINPKKTYLNFRNSLSMLFKNEPGIALIWKLVLRSLLDLIAALKFMLVDSFQHGLAVFRAHIDFWIRIRSNLSKRKQVRRSKGNIFMIYKKSIAIQFFFLGKKEFGQLQKNFLIIPD